MAHLYNCNNNTGCLIMFGGSTSGVLRSDGYVYWPSSGTALSTSVCSIAGENQVISVTCPSNSYISAVPFASYGTPSGTCGGYALGTCNATASASVTASLCVGFSNCAFTVQ
jgi:hypothetical protein